MDFLLPQELQFPFFCVAKPPSAWAGIFNTNAISHSSQGFFWHELSCERAESEEMQIVLRQARKSHFLPQRANNHYRWLEQLGLEPSTNEEDCARLTLGPPVQFGNPLRCV